MHNHTSSPSESKVVSLANYKAKKSTDQELSRNRRPLYVSHLKNKSDSQKPKERHLGDRISRIKVSLDRINNLMNDLKAMSERKK